MYRQILIKNFYLKKYFALVGNVQTVFFFFCLQCAEKKTPRLMFYNLIKTIQTDSCSE